MMRDESVGLADDDANIATKKHTTAKTSRIAGAATRKSARLAARVDPKTQANASASKTTVANKNGKKVKTTNAKSAKTPSPQQLPLRPVISNPIQLQSPSLSIPPPIGQPTSSNSNAINTPVRTTKTPPSKGKLLFSNWSKTDQNQILANSFGPQNQNTATDSTTANQPLSQPTPRVYRVTPTPPRPPQDQLQRIFDWNPRDGTVQVAQIPSIKRNNVSRRAGSVPTYSPSNDPPSELQRIPYEAGESDDYRPDLGVWERLLGKLICIFPFLLISLLLGALLAARILHCTFPLSTTTSTPPLPLHAYAPFPSSHASQFRTPFTPETITQLSTFAETIGADPWLLRTCILPRQITYLPLVACQQRLPWYNLTSAQVAWLNEKSDWSYELTWAITEEFNTVWELGFEVAELMTSWMLSPEGPSAVTEYRYKRCEACGESNREVKAGRGKNWWESWMHSLSLGGRLVKNKKLELPDSTTTTREDFAKRRILEKTEPQVWAGILVDDDEDED